jgi:hypothetical protein
MAGARGSLLARRLAHSFRGEPRRALASGAPTWRPQSRSGHCTTRWATVTGSRCRPAVGLWCPLLDALSKFLSDGPDPIISTGSWPTEIAGPLHRLSRRVVPRPIPKTRRCEGTNRVQHSDAGRPGIPAVRASRGRSGNRPRAHRRRERRSGFGSGPTKPTAWQDLCTSYTAVTRRRSTAPRASSCSTARPTRTRRWQPRRSWPKGSGSGWRRSTRVTPGSSCDPSRSYFAAAKKRRSREPRRREARGICCPPRLSGSVPQSILPVPVSQRPGW